jgi:peptidoglycan/LPS O-acetylase OafA/YrhL
MGAMPHRANDRKIDYLELLRFILAFLTMAWHYYYYGPRAGFVEAVPVNLPGFRFLSFTVEVFFIISGFIIIASALNRNANDFLVGRIVRLGPCLLICATLTFMIGLPFGSQPSMLNYLGSILILPLALHPGADSSYWSLHFEILFYGFIFLYARFTRIDKQLFWIALILTTFDALSVLIQTTTGIDNDDAFKVRYLLDKYASFFAIGILMYMVLIQRRRSFAIVATLVAACVLGCIRCYEISNTIAQRISDAPVSAATGVCIFAAVLVTFLLFIRGERRPLLSKVFKTLGRTSYPLYLLHQNAGYSLIHLFNQKFRLGFDARPLIMIGMVVLSALVATYAEPVLASVYRRYLRPLGTIGRSARSGNPAAPE